MAKLHQESLELDEHKVKVSISQARKVAEYANRADWHFRRANVMQASSLLGRAREVLLGCEIPDAGPLRKVYLFVVNPPKALRLDDMENLRDNAMEVLELIERTYLGLPVGTVDDDDGEVAGGD